MKSFLALLLIFCAFESSAQTEDSLFPEFTIDSAPTEKKTHEKLTTESETKEAVKEQEEIAESETSDSSEENTTKEEDLFTDSSNSEENSEETTTPPAEENPEAEEEEDEEQHIYLTVDNVNATLAPDRNASFCTASLVVFNGLKKDLKKISGKFTIGNMEKDFSFTNLPVQQSDAMKYVFIGKSCERILDDPLIAVLKCQVKDWTEKKCKSKVLFVSQKSSDDVIE